MKDYTTRKCSKCKNLYPATSEYFRKDKYRKLGIGYVCRLCEQHIRQTPAYREQQNRYHRSDKAKTTKAAYLKTKQGRAMVKAKNLRQLQLRPDAIRANKMLNNAVRNGKILPISTQRCADCGKPAKHYHHESYAKEHWYDVIPLCITCHRARHGV